MGIGTPEANLWASVLHAAMLDGFYGCPVGYSGPSENSQAVVFLTAEHGEWAASRRHICGMLGLEDSALVALCRAVFEGAHPPSAPGYESRHISGLEKQRAVYRAMKDRPEPRPEPELARPEPEPARAEPMEAPTPMEEAIFDAMTQPRTSTPVEVTVDGFLYWPIKAPDTGTLAGQPLPAPGTQEYRVLRMATRQRGGNLIGLRQCGDWEAMLREIVDYYGLEVIILKDGMPVNEMTGETHLFLTSRHL